MLFWKNDNNVSRLSYEQVKLRVRELEKQIADVNDEAIRALHNDVATSKFEVDFDTMDVFSIERNHNNQRAYTVIGYFKTIASEHGKDKHVHEWTFYCSHDEHQRLVESFNAWKGKKK